jgi:hypothetical protein
MGVWSKGPLGACRGVAIVGVSIVDVVSNTVETGINLPHPTGL